MHLTAAMNRFAKAALLFFFFALCALAFVLSARLRENDARLAQPRELFAIVNNQVAAFRADDFRSAYRQASSGVQQKFTLPQFEAMIRKDYGALAAAHRIEFGNARMEGGTALLEVFFFDDDGSARLFLYNLLAEGAGWKIGGVEEISLPRRERPFGGSSV